MSNRVNPHVTDPCAACRGWGFYSVSKDPDEVATCLDCRGTGHRHKEDKTMADATTSERETLLAILDNRLGICVCQSYVGERHDRMPACPRVKLADELAAGFRRRSEASALERFLGKLAGSGAYTLDFSSAEALHGHIVSLLRRDIAAAQIPGGVE